MKNVIVLLFLLCIAVLNFISFDDERLFWLIIGCGSIVGIWFLSPSMNVLSGIAFISWLDWLFIVFATLGILYVIVVGNEINLIMVLDYFLFFSFGVLAIRRMMKRQ
ncbi:MAG: hypothetical protein ABW201_09980 [Candidatus Thiodiazotropha sp.]